MNTWGSTSLVPIVLMAQLLGSVAEGADRNTVFFSRPINLSQTAKGTFSHSVRVALDTTGNINVVWADSRCLPEPPYTCQWHLFYSHSNDGAATFSAPRDIANQQGTQPIFGPQISVGNRGQIAVVWEQNVSGSWEILFTRSLDGGATFSNPQMLSDYSGLAVDPQLALDSAGNINVVWQTQEFFNPNAWSIWFARSTDAGVHFSRPKNLCDVGATCNWPKIAVEPSGAVDIVWAAAPCPACSYDVFFARSTNGGANFVSARNLSNSPDGLFAAPQLTVGQRGTINVVWSKGDSSSGFSDIFFSGSDNQAASFVTTNVSSRQGRAYFPLVFSRTDNDVDVFWHDDMVGGIFYSRSFDERSEFSQPSPVSSFTRSFNPDGYVQVDRRNNVTLVWEEFSTAGSRIAFSRSTDGGSTFSNGQVFSSSNVVYQSQVATDTAGNLAIAWLSDTAEVQDIFLSRGVSFDSIREDISGAPVAAFRNAGQRRAMLNALSRVESALVDGDEQRAVAYLDDALDHLNRCGGVTENDWLLDCATQRQIQSSLRILRAGLSDLLLDQADVRKRPRFRG
jgi:hypothetical protein